MPPRGLAKIATRRLVGSYVLLYEASYEKCISMPNLVSIPAGYLDVGGAAAAYVIDRSTNLCYFWATSYHSSTGILIDCCRLRKIPAAVAVFQTMSESCGDVIAAAPATPASPRPAGS